MPGRRDRVGLARASRVLLAAGSYGTTPGRCGVLRARGLGGSLDGRIRWDGAACAARIPLLGEGAFGLYDQDNSVAAQFFFNPTVPYCAFDPTKYLLPFFPSLEIRFLGNIFIFVGLPNSASM